MRSQVRTFSLALLAISAGMVIGCQGKPVSSNGPMKASPAAAPDPPTEPKIAIRSMNRRVPVIMYHDVLALPTAHPVYFDTMTDEFEKQMKEIQDRGFQPISVDQLYDHLTKGTEIPAKSIILSFDDNYRGFYENAVPILKRYNYPAVEFVHTNFIGVETGDHPKMSWDQLKELAAGGLVTIGAHTESHPVDIRKLSPDEQEKEIVGSKDVLEKGLGRKVDYFAYPDGANDEVSQGIVKNGGFKMAFTTASGLVEESPNLQALHRYEHLKLTKALDAAEKAMADGPSAVEEQELHDSPVTLTVGEFEGLKIGVIKGGLPKTVLSGSREGVADLVRENGGVAGVNGSFFAMAAIASSSNQMIGPTYVPDGKVFMPETNPALLPKLRNRPMVIWNDKKIAIFNFQPESLNSEEPYRDFMPDFENLFLAGGWIVHRGVPLLSEQLTTYATHDHNDTRRRAFFGWTATGEPMIGASLQTCTTARLAEAAAAAGVQEAVLLDSGFSTSLVFNDHIVVTGHTSKDLPSRPVPHAIVLMGRLQLEGADAMLASAAEGAKAPEDIEGERREAARRRRNRLFAMQRKKDDAAKAASRTNPLDDPTSTLRRRRSSHRAKSSQLTLPGGTGTGTTTGGGPPPPPPPPTTTGTTGTTGTSNRRIRSRQRRRGTSPE